jgi:hypothetical protein
MECIVVTYCLSKSAYEDQAKYEFHFKGFFAGNKIKEISVLGKLEDFFIGNEYILHLKIEKVEKNTLYGVCLRKKDLNLVKTDFL